MALMQLSTIETDVLGIVARIEISYGRMARFDDAEDRKTCRTLDELGLLAITDTKTLTVACMRDDGRSELAERGFYRGGSHVRVPK